jgi:uncharacterized YigZ family protein
LKSTYRTLKELSDGLYKEKGSKFIGYAVACYTELEAKEFIETWKKQNHQARHLCYAYRFGVNQDVYRANDDGEPNNSAGAPILGQIQSFDLSNVLIGVVRYYGGTKLGVGGLINAYRTAAKEAIEDGEIIVKEVYEWVRLEFNYNDMPSVMSFIKKFDLHIEKQIFELNCEMILSLPLNQKENLKTELEELSSMEITILGIY